MIFALLSQAVGSVKHSVGTSERSVMMENSLTYYRPLSPPSLFTPLSLTLAIGNHICK